MTVGGPRLTPGQPHVTYPMTLCSAANVPSNRAETHYPRFP
jgi:hypothetical protein